MTTPTSKFFNNFKPLVGNEAVKECCPGGSDDPVNTCAEVVALLTGCLSFEALICAIAATCPVPVIPIEVENTLFVDSIYGNNGTALPERLDLPYLTVAGAMAIATSGQMIFVRPGDHSVTANIFKDGVKIWCEPNANLNFIGAGTNHILVPGIANQTFSILGNGKINSFGASMITASAGSTGSLITIQADEVVYNNAAGTMVNCTDAKVLWDVRKTTILNGVKGFLFQGISESDIDAGVFTCSSAVMTSRPYQLDNIVVDASLKMHKFSCEASSSVIGQDLGWVALATTTGNNIIEINLNGIYLPATAGLGSCVAFNGDGSATINGEYYTTGGGIFVGLGIGRVINNSFVKTIDTLTAVRVASVSGTGARLINNGVLRGSSSDYAVGLGVVDDASVSGAGQTSGFGSFENHGTIINENSAATGVIFKAGVAPSDTTLILGAETVLYATSLGADCIDALVAQDVKCYGYPVANRNVDVLITNLISGTNVIFDPLVETNYLT